MQTYLILRRCAWRDEDELQAAAERSVAVGADMGGDVRWIRSYALAEGGAGGVGTVCIYEATSPEAIREHSDRVGMPADEIVAVCDTVVIRPDPEPDTYSDPR